MQLTLQTAPANLPVSLAEAKDQCRVFSEIDEDDGMIEGLVRAAVSYLDGPTGILGRAIMQQDWLLSLEQWPNVLRLPIEPLATLTVKYIDPNGVLQTLDPASYVVSTSLGMQSKWYMRPGQSPLAIGSPDVFPVRFEIRGGVATAAEVPDDVKLLIKMLVAHWYRNREAVTVGSAASELPMAVSTLISKLRVHL